MVSSLTGHLSVTGSVTFSLPVPDLALKATRELLVFARLIGARLADGFVTQPPHEAIERRTADPEAAGGFGPIALGLGQRARFARQPPCRDIR
jgi:hypothetical protein